MDHWHGQDRIVDIAAVVNEARWEYVSEVKTDLSWQRWAGAEDWRLYCLDKRA